MCVSYLQSEGYEDFKGNAHFAVTLRKKVLNKHEVE